MERVKWIEANGKLILSVDYSGLKTIEEQSAVLEEQTRLANTAASGFYAIINFTNTTGSSELMDKMKKTANEAAHAEKAAVIGIDGIKGILFQGYLRVTGRKNMKVCGTEEEAIAYICS
jgi:hypothetical protein